MENGNVVDNSKSAIGPGLNRPGSSMRFTDYDVVGFDLDYTLVRYKVGNMVQMEYEGMARYLIDKCGYSEEICRPIDSDIDFLQRGLLLDLKRGNLLRVSETGYIMKAFHGTREISDGEINGLYPNRTWCLADKFVKDPIQIWNNNLEQEVRALLDYFDIAAGLLFARTVDSIDKQNKEHSQTYSYDIWKDIQSSLKDMFSTENFGNNYGHYFPRIKRNQEDFYYRGSENLLRWLRDLKSSGVTLFMITGSDADYMQFSADFALGPHWRELFDVVVCFARKPGFFTERRPFLSIGENPEEVPISNLRKGGVYRQGNWTDLQEVLKQFSPSRSHPPRYLYVGDNVVQDVFAPGARVSLDTVAICEELNSEGAFGFSANNEDKEWIASSKWGSYFQCGSHKSSWYHLIQKYALACVPNLEYVASHAIDHTFKNI